MSTAAIVIACVLVIGLLMAIRRLIRLAIIALVVIGAGFSSGVLPVPQAISGPIDHFQSEVHTWQKRQSASLACAGQAMRSAESADAPEAEPSCGKGK